MSVVKTCDLKAHNIFSEASNTMPRKETPRSLYLYRKEALKACEELCYSQETFERIAEAENEFQIERIMRTAAKREL